MTICLPTYTSHRELVGVEIITLNNLRDSYFHDEFERQFKYGLDPDWIDEDPNVMAKGIYTDSSPIIIRG